MIEQADLGQLDEIVFVLTDRTKPTLVSISVSSQNKRDKLRHELDLLLPDYRSALLDLSGQSITSLFRAIRAGAPSEVLSSTPGEYLLHVYGLEDSLLVSLDGDIASSSLIAELNMEREKLFHEFPCTLILWTTPYFVEKLQRQAPDLWDWITYSYHFFEEQSSEVPGGIPEPLPAPPGVTEERQKHIEKLEEGLKNLRFDQESNERVIRTRLSLLKTIGAEYLAAFLPLEAIRKYTTALVLLQQTKHSKFEEAVILLHLGKAYFQSLNFSEALRAYNNSLRIQEEAGMEQRIGSTLLEIGLVYEVQGNISEALNHYLKAIEWSEEIEDVVNSLERIIPELSISEQQVLKKELISQVTRLVGK